MTWRDRPAVEIRRRLRALTGGWSTEIRGTLFGNATRGIVGTLPLWQGAGEPYWIELPGVLVKAFACEEHRIRGKDAFLRDIRWAQYCLYLAARVHDDIFDRRLPRSAFQPISRKCEEEASRVFHRCMGNSAEFLQFYRECVRSAKDAYKNVRHLRDPTVRTHRRIMEGEYKRVSGVFKVGSAAVCARYERFPDFRRVERGLEHLAVICQIVDDVVDLEEDLAAGQLNYVARFFLGNKLTCEADMSLLEDKIHSNFYFTDKAERLSLELNRHLSLAADAFEEACLDECLPIINRYTKALRSLEATLQSRRSSYFLSFPYMNPDQINQASGYIRC